MLFILHHPRSLHLVPRNATRRIPSQRHTMSPSSSPSSSTISLLPHGTSSRGKSQKLFPFKKNRDVTDPTGSTSVQSGKNKSLSKSTPGASDDLPKRDNSPQMDKKTENDDKGGETSKASPAPSVATKSSSSSTESGQDASNSGSTGAQKKSTKRRAAVAASFEALSVYR